MSWLLDTNVISETSKRHPSPEVLAWVLAQPAHSLHTTPLAIAELRAGIEIVRDPVRRTELADWLDYSVRPLFGTRIMAQDEAFCLALLAVLKRAKARRRTLPTTDLLFAAAAERHGLVVVTRNVKHFAGSGVRVLDPWQADPNVVVCD